MNASESFEALRRANPRARPGFAQRVEAAGEVVRARIVAGSDAPLDVRVATSRVPRSRPRRRLVGVSLAGAALAALAATTALVAVWPGGHRGVENAAAAVKRAATVTAASAKLSGTAVVRITHNGEVWAAQTIRWHDRDLSITNHEPDRRGRVGSKFLLVDGTMYGVDAEDGGWVIFGSPESIDPDSGTTPGEILAAVRVDVGGLTLRRITDGMTGLTTAQRDDGSAVYSGAVAAGVIARETGFKEGRAIRVLPFGHVAHDEAADPGSPLDAAVTVGPDGLVREITVRWGRRTSMWVYTVSYGGLGETPAPIAPADAKNPLRDRLRAN
jgi:hypothetical protein